MMSKSLFLVSMKENNKRRLWVWAISLLGFVLLFPIAVALTANRVVSRSAWMAETYGAEVAEKILHERLISGMCDIFGFSLLLPAITAVLAVVSSIQGFSWLYSRKKIDFYMGIPVKRKKRFFVIWLNGILLYLIPYAIGLVIGMILAASNGGLDGTVVHTALLAFVVNLCFYLGIYHMAMLAVMLTGNIVITGFGFLVFCLYEWLVRSVIQGFQDLFFRYFSYYGSHTEPILSPFSMYVHIVETFDSRRVLDFKYLAGLLIFAAVTGAVSYICYLKRPAESAGKAMVFEITKPFVKIMLIVPLSLAAGLIMADIVSFIPLSYADAMEGIGYVIFAMALVVVIGCAVMQVIYEFDIKGARNKKSHIVICGVLTALIFMAFRYDFTGYDSYIPNQEKMESAAFVPDYYETGMQGGVCFDLDGSYLSEEEYGDRYMYLENTEDICELAEISMNGYNEYMASVDEKRYDGESNKHWSSGTLIYRLKNGRSVKRRIWVNVNDERTTELLDKIMGSWEFKKGYIPGASENLSAMLSQEKAGRRINASYGNGVYFRKMNQADALEFLEIYKDDLALSNFSNVKENMPVSEFDLNIEEEIAGSGGAVRGLQVSMNIYPFYKKSIAWLEQHGYYMDYQLNVDDVDHIQIINQNYEIQEKLSEKLSDTAGAAEITAAGVREMAISTAEKAYGDYEIDTRVYMDYTEKEDIANIADCIYTQEMAYTDNWDGGKEYDNNYQVIVYFKADSEINRSYGSNAYYCFMKGEVPDFVSMDTCYKE